MPRAQKIFTRRVTDGHLMAVRNWRHRMTTDDAIIAVPLTSEQLDFYQSEKEAGRGDETIFNQLFPKPVRGRIALPIEELTKSQLVNLIQQIHDVELPSLHRMSSEDLAALLRSLCRDQTKTEAYLI
ncbi:MAG: hypothetical protein AAGA23_07795 [Pseudomonadota bacterium]